MFELVKDVLRRMRCNVAGMIRMSTWLASIVGVRNDVVRSGAMKFPSSLECRRQ